MSQEHAIAIATNLFENTKTETGPRAILYTVGDFHKESTPAPLGASDAPIPAANGSREAEQALSPSESDAGVGSDDLYNGQWQEFKIPTGRPSRPLASNKPNTRDKAKSFLGKWTQCDIKRQEKGRSNSSG